VSRGGLGHGEDGRELSVEAITPGARWVSFSVAVHRRYAHVEGGEEGEEDAMLVWRGRRGQYDSREVTSEQRPIDQRLLFTQQKRSRPRGLIADATAHNSEAADSEGEGEAAASSFRLARDPRGTDHTERPARRGRGRADCAVQTEEDRGQQ